MVDDTARDRAIYHALKAADEVAAALQAHLIEEHGADPDRSAAQNPSTNSLKLLRQARERLGEGLRSRPITSPSLTRSPCATNNRSIQNHDQRQESMLYVCLDLAQFAAVGILAWLGNGLCLYGFAPRHSVYWRCGGFRCRCPSVTDRTKRRTAADAASG
jgi:hypothetical protein